VAGPEFGSENGSVMIMARTLYGLKSSRVAWRATLAETMNALGYRLTQADPDACIKKAYKESGEPYHPDMIIYVDDALHIAENPEEDMAKLGRAYRLKDDV